MILKTCIKSLLRPFTQILPVKCSQFSTLSNISAKQQSAILDRKVPASLNKTLQQVWCGTVQQVRTHTRKRTNFSGWKVINKHNIEKRMSTYDGQCTLWRRYLKGRWRLAPFHQLLPAEYNGRVLPPHQKHLSKPFGQKKKKVQIITERF